MLADEIKEVIFIGMPGPTHHYGGLSGDNVASGLNRGSISNPKAAAKQTLQLIQALRALGLTVGVLPPQLRPHLPLLRQYFSGDAGVVIQQAANQNPALLEKASSSSAMWVANAATVSPVIDSFDRKLHLTVANLQTNLHRRIEAVDTHSVFRQIWASVPDAVVHAPLPEILPDEGAANHMRLAPRHGERGLHVFVYGADGSMSDPKTARQSKAAFETIVKNHTIPDGQVVLVRQNPEVIRQGVFHNDVIAVSNEYLLLAHERAYAGGIADIERIEKAYARLHPHRPFYRIVVKDADLSVEEAVHTYLFNSQIVTKPDGSMAVIAPSELQTLYEGKAARLLEKICADASNPIVEAHYLDLRQSMRNGGGPACLRLRVPMTVTQIAAMKASVRVLVDDALIPDIEGVIDNHYPEQLAPPDVRDPHLYDTCRSMLADLSGVLRIQLYNPL